MKRAADGAAGNDNGVVDGQTRAQEHLPPPPDELLVKKHSARNEIKKGMQEVAGLLNIDEKGPAVSMLVTSYIPRLIHRQ